MYHNGLSQLSRLLFLSLLLSCARQPCQLSRDRPRNIPTAQLGISCSAHPPQSAASARFSPADAPTACPRRVANQYECSRAAAFRRLDLADDAVTAASTAHF